MNGTSCCPDPIVSESFDGKAWLMIAARNLSIAEEMKSDVLTLCNGCFSSLSRSNYLLKGDVNLKEEINNYLRQVNRKISGTIDVKHVAKVVHDLGPMCHERIPISGWEGGHLSCFRVKLLFEEYWQVGFGYTRR